MSESKQSFTVKDRRQFTVEGERKASAEDAEWGAPSSETGSRIAVPPSASPAQGTGEVEFGSFLVSLSAQAGAMLAAEGAERDLDGARHIIGPLNLGARIDSELDGQPNAQATGDDIVGIDDEEGVTFSTALIANAPVTIQVVSSGAGLLQGWFDFNRNGTWCSAGKTLTRWKKNSPQSA